MTTAAPNKKEARAEVTRRSILVASSRLFARRGYHKTTIADIAQAIGLTSGAIFHHFPSKEALLEAVVAWLARGIGVYSDYLNRVDTPGSSTVDGLIAIMCDHFHRQPEATICLAALATEFAGSHHPMEATLKEVYEDFVGTFARVLERHPKVRNPRAAAIAFVGSVQGIAIQGLLREHEHTIDELANAFLTLFADW